jgi:hypothetical protein
MRTQSSDTHPEIERLQIEGLRRRGTVGRLETLWSWSAGIVGLSVAGLRRLHPELDERHIRRLFVELNYGAEIADQFVKGARGDKMESNEMPAVLGPVVEAFEALGIAYCVGGSVASSAHGIPRSTIDIDLVAQLSVEHIRPLFERLGETYYFPEKSALEAVQRRSSFNLIHFDTSIKVDIFVLQTHRYAQEAFQRRTRKPIRQDDVHTFWLTTAEDIVLSKLDWYRMGGEVSERQWNDVLGVLKVQAGALDREYLGRWAEELGLSGLLGRALDDAGLA